MHQPIGLLHASLYHTADQLVGACACGCGCHSASGRSWHDQCRCLARVDHSNKSWPGCLGWCLWLPSEFRTVRDKLNSSHPGPPLPRSVLRAAWAAGPKDSGKLFGTHRTEPGQVLPSPRSPWGQLPKLARKLGSFTKSAPYFIRPVQLYSTCMN